MESRGNDFSKIIDSCVFNLLKTFISASVEEEAEAERETEEVLPAKKGKKDKKENKKNSEIEFVKKVVNVLKNLFPKSTTNLNIWRG